MPRGIRARLTATYTLAATVLIVVGAVLFLVTLTAGLHANLDSDLSTRVNTLSSVLQDADDGAFPAVTRAGRARAPRRRCTPGCRTRSTPTGPRPAGSSPRAA